MLPSNDCALFDAGSEAEYDVDISNLQFSKLRDQAELFVPLDLVKYDDWEDGK